VTRRLRRPREQAARAVRRAVVHAPLLAADARGRGPGEGGDARRFRGEIYDTLQILFGSVYVSQFNKYSRLWQVIVQADPHYRSKPDDIDEVYVRSHKGQMVPIKAVITMKYASGADLVTRFNNFPAARVMGNAAPGYSSGQAIEAMERVAREVLPADYSFAWSGEAFEAKKAGVASSMVFAFGLLMVFLILAAQYEKWSLPFGVLMAVPFALLGR